MSVVYKHTYIRNIVETQRNSFGEKIVCKFSSYVNSK